MAVKNALGYKIPNACLMIHHGYIKGAVMRKDIYLSLACSKYESYHKALAQRKAPKTGTQAGNCPRNFSVKENTFTFTITPTERCLT